MALNVRGFCLATKNMLTFHNHFHTTSNLLAGHSKWANIRHTKAANDSQRSTLFNRLARQIRLSIQEGGSPNPQINSLLRNAIDDALKKNMPMATIQGTIKRSQASKELIKKHFLEIKLINTPVYLVCVVYTENLHSLRMQIAPIVKKCGGSFTDAPHLFESRGVIQASKTDNTTNASEEDYIADAIECGAQEVEMDMEGKVNFICEPRDTNRVRQALVGRGFSIGNEELIFLPKVAVAVSDSDQKTCDTLCNKLRDVEGIHDVYDNIDRGTGT